jgi:hypothetical protein
MTKKLPTIVAVHAGQPMVSSLTMAELLERSHDQVLRAIRRVQAKKPSLDVLVESDVNSRGKAIPVYWLNEKASLLVMPYVGGDKSIDGQEKLVDAYLAYHRKFSRRIPRSPEWQEQRLLGKSARKEVVDTIQEFVEYATRQGSKNAAMYYTSITKGTYAALFMLEHGGNWKGLREFLSSLQLNSLATAEHIASRAIRQSMDIDMFYRDIYVVAIDQVKKFAELVGKSTVTPEVPLSLVKKDS